MKAEPAIGIALLAVSFVIFSTSLPALFSGPCIMVSENLCAYSIPPPSHRSELSLFVFGVAFAIGGAGLLAVTRLERAGIKGKRRQSQQ